MDKIIVYLDDAAYAQQQLAPMMGGTGAAPAHWILVACPPRLTRHISKWVSHSARESWRAKWAEQLFAEVAAPLLTRGHPVTQLVASNAPLLEQTQALLLEHGGARVLDARRPKVGQDLQPVTADQPVAGDSRWTVPGAVAGLAAVMVLAAE